MSDGIKFDDNKIKMELLPFDSLLEVGKVLTYGAKKYAPHNWKLIKDSERYIGALLRHLIAMECGERIDPDSGLTHVSHIACNALFLVHFDLEKQKKAENLMEALVKIGKECEISKEDDYELKVTQLAKLTNRTPEYLKDLLKYGETMFPVQPSLVNLDWSCNYKEFTAHLTESHVFKIKKDEYKYYCTLNGNQFFEVSRDDDSYNSDLDIAKTECSRKAKEVIENLKSDKSCETVFINHDYSKCKIVRQPDGWALSRNGELVSGEVFSDLLTAFERAYQIEMESKKIPSKVSLKNKEDLLVRGIDSSSWVSSEDQWWASYKGLNFDIKFEDDLYKGYLNGEEKPFVVLPNLNDVMNKFTEMISYFEKTLGFIESKNDILYFRKDRYDYEIVTQYEHRGFDLEQYEDEESIKCKHFGTLDEAIGELKKWQVDAFNYSAIEIKEEPKRTPESFELIWKVSGDYAKALFGSDTYSIYMTPGHCTCFKNKIEIGYSSSLEVAYEVCQRDVDKFILELGLVFEEDSNNKYVNGFKYTRKLSDTGSTIEFSDGTLIGPSLDANYLLRQISNFIEDRVI